MEKPKVFELRAEYNPGAGAIVITLYNPEGKPRAVKSVPMQPHSTYKSRLSLAHQWLAQIAGVPLADVRGA